jgi:Tfp pilus assembly protein PilX
MKPIRNRQIRSRGSTLIVVLMLILLASLLSLFALNVGLFEQRASASDVRTRLVQQTVEGGLSQGIEYIKANGSLINPFTNPGLWKLCSPDDTTFPCGSVPRCAMSTQSGTMPPPTGTPSSNGTDTCDAALARRGNMYKDVGGANYDVNGNGSKNDALDSNSLPLDRLLSTVGNGFTVNYGVGALVCVIKTPTNRGDPTECTTNSAQSSGTFIYTVTAVGNISGESAGTTLSTSFGLSPIAPGALNPPTLTASGSVDLTGNGTFTPNPNAGGPGVPVTVWTPGCIAVQGAGTVHTCYLEDWMRADSGQYSFATNSDGSTSTDFVVCTSNGNKACSCTNSNSLTTGPGTVSVGIDILSNNSSPGCQSIPVTGTPGCTAGLNCKADYDVQPTEYPCDLCQYVFGVSAWDDRAVQSPSVANSACNEAGASMPSGGGDCFCEYHKSTTVQMADGTTQTVGYDEAYLYKKATYILSVSTHSNWVDAGKLASNCSDLAAKAATTGGLLWDQTGGCLASGIQFGYPDKPVILVSDGSAGLKQNNMFGIVFVRDTTPAGQSTTKYGGVASFTADSSGTIYGSVIVQGSVTKFNGSAAVIYNNLIGTNLGLENSLNSASPVPGSWTDRYSY